MMSTARSIVFFQLTLKLSHAFVASAWRSSSTSFSTNSGGRRTAELPLYAIANLPNHRFWTHSLPINNTNNTLAGQYLIEDQLSDANGQSGAFDLSRVEKGVLFSTYSNTLVPIHDGKLQIQHTTAIPEEMLSSNNLLSNSVGTTPVGGRHDKLFLCAFSPRASHVCISPNEEERPTDFKRKECVDMALERLSISWEDLLSDRYAGTPPAKIYRSFVAPRPNAVHILEPVERAANRTSAQIELALRQLRADESAYLRNTDRASPAIASVPDDRVVNPVVLLLDNIRSAFNVGSMFRTGETAGIAEIVTCGITAHPPHPKLRKTAFSAVDAVPTRHFDDVLTAIRQLKEEGYTIIAMETTSRSKLYTDIEYPAKCVLVVGNEVTGVDTRVMEQADLIAEIPTYGVKNSLNVASAAPIVLFEVLRQWQSRNIIGTGKVSDSSLVQREMASDKIDSSK